MNLIPEEDPEVVGINDANSAIMHMSILHGQSTSFQSTGTEEEALLEMKGLL